MPRCRSSCRSACGWWRTSRRAVAHEEFFIEYQPIVDLGTRSLLGVEALVRWRHPDLGVLMPDRFIQIAEECGQIVKLGRWVLVRACRELRAWRDSVAGGAGLRVAVNISVRHLSTATWPRTWSTP